MTWPEVQRIRAWVRSDGFGLDVQEQVRALQAVYEGVKPTTLREIIRNETWGDASYDPTIPLPDVNREKIAGNAILMFVLLLWLTFRNRSCLVTILPGIFPGYYDVQPE